MKKSSNVYLVILILIGSVAGNIIGKALSAYLPVLNYGENIGFGPAELNLSIFSMTLGFSASLTVSGIIGIIIAIIVYKKF